MDGEVIDLDNWTDYGEYRIFISNLKYGTFYKAVRIGDDPENPKVDCSYARHPMRAVAFLMQKEAENLIKESKK